MPLGGWAMAVGATDLSTGQVTPDTRTPEQVDMLEAFVDQLYNGWSHSQVGKPAARYYLPRYYLPRLADSGLTYSEFVGSVIALDPAHLDSNTDIEAMRKLLPPAWEAERAELSGFWSR
jgi:hypothetical protein